MALESEWRLVLVASAILEGGVVLATVRWDPTGNKVQSFVFLTGLVFTALLAGVVVRALRSQLDWLAERAERLERERDQQASLAAVTERARIAGEMHDVVSHNIQVMVTLADAASTAQASDPARAAEAIHEISSTGRQALTDMRRLLGVLREEPTPAAVHGNGTAANRNGRPPFAPQPGLRELDALIERVRGTGLEVTVQRVGAPFEVSGAAGLTVYRIVQEALTNALKHAEQPAAVEVRLAFDDPDVSVWITDDGRATVTAPSSAAGNGSWERGRGRDGNGRAGAPGGGHGLAGMTERAARFGGTLSAGPPGRRLGGRGHPARLQGTRPGVTIRVVLADDQALLRKGFRMILEAEEGIEIVGEAPDGADAVRLVELYRPDVVLMDVRMPVLDGIEATRAITGSPEGEATRVLILTTFDLDEYAFSALRGGRQRLPAQGRATGRAHLGHPHRGPGRRGGVAPHHPANLEEYADTLPDLSEGGHGSSGGAEGAESIRRWPP